MIGGEKGKPGCERKYAGTYCFGLKQEETDALRDGSDLHKKAEVYQDTGVIPEPESRLGALLASGAHKLTQTGPMLVEWEHVGELPDGTPYVAYLDGHSARGGITNCVIILDIKTTSNPAFALVPGDGEMGLLTHPQPMFYSWILLCNVHWCCPPLPDAGPECQCGQYPGCVGSPVGDVYGPKQWEIWDPKERNAKDVRLRWIYFLTRGVPRAWEVTDFMTPDRAAYWMQDTAMPLVARILAIHAWHAAQPPGTVTLDDFDRNFGACTIGGRAMKWCGAGERGACNLEALGTPIDTLITIGRKPVTSAAERLAALKAKAGITAPFMDQRSAVAAIEASKAELTTQSAVVTASETAEAPSAANATSAVSPSDAVAAPAAETAPAGEPKRGRGRPPKAGVGLPAINPPEAPSSPPAPTPIVAGPAVGVKGDLSLAAYSHDQLVDEFNRRGYTVATQKGPAR
jgi:hypothetical protein